MGEIIWRFGAEFQTISFYPAESMLVIVGIVIQPYLEGYIFPTTGEGLVI